MGLYQRYLTPDTKPYNPSELAKLTELIVCRGEKRKYTDFYATGVYGGIATGYTVGCCLRCYYCWVGWSRDFPERYGEFYSPKEVFSKLREIARRCKVKRMRISGAEPTIGKTHLLKLLELVEGTDFLFILETNGFLFGEDEEYVREVSKFKKVHVRVCLKAGFKEGLTQRTGASPESLELPYKAIEYLLAYGARFHVAAMTDPRIMSNTERKFIIEKLYKIHPLLAKNLEEEIIDLYDTTKARLRYARVNLQKIDTGGKRC